MAEIKAVVTAVAGSHNSYNVLIKSLRETSPAVIIHENAFPEDVVKSQRQLGNPMDIEEVVFLTDIPEGSRAPVEVELFPDEEPYLLHISLNIGKGFTPYQLKEITTDTSASMLYVKVDELEEQIRKLVPLYRILESCLKTFLFHFPNSEQLIKDNANRLSAYVSSLPPAGANAQRLIRDNIQKLLKAVYIDISSEDSITEDKICETFDKFLALSESSSVRVKPTLDILSVTLDKYIDQFLGILSRLGNIELLLETRAVNMSLIRKYKDTIKFRITMLLNSDFMEKSCEAGYPSVDERISSIKALAKLTGRKVSVKISKILVYDAWADDYARLLSKILENPDIEELDTLRLDFFTSVKDKALIVSRAFRKVIDDNAGNDELAHFSDKGDRKLEEYISKKFAQIKTIVLLEGMPLPWTKYSNKQLFYPSIHQQVPLKGTSGDAAMELKLHVLEFDYSQRGIIYGNEDSTSIYNIKDESFLCYPVKFVGSVHKMSEPEWFSFKSSDGKHHRWTVVSLHLKDSRSNDILCLPVLKSSLPKNFLSKLTSQFIFMGTVIAALSGKTGGPYVFYLKDISHEVRASDLIMLSNSEKIQIEGLLSSVSKGYGSIRKYIEKKLIENIPIRGLEKAYELSKTIKQMIIQSFSFGLADKGAYSNKIHSLVIGPPASGKGILTKIALCLNPVGYELPASSNKITEAGLIGNVEKVERGGYKSNPGYLPLATGGIICMQDFHELARKDKGLWGILSKAMEDGEVIDSTSARTTHLAVASIHIDMNRLSQVRDKNASGGFKDLNIPFNILSRFDYISEIPEDAERQADVAADMILQGNDLHTEYSKDHDVPWKRELKEIIAYCQLKYTESKLPDEVKKHIDQKIKRAIDALRSQGVEQSHLGSIETRLANSVMKYVKAIACSELSDTVTLEMVDEAFTFIEDKINFIKAYRMRSDEASSSANEGTAPGKDPSGKRQDKIVELFKGKIVSTKDIHDKVCEALQENVSSKTTERALFALKKIGKVKKVRHGEWEII